jgi:hypothetical protein
MNDRKDVRTLVAPSTGTGEGLLCSESLSDPQNNFYDRPLPSNLERMENGNVILRSVSQGQEDLPLSFRNHSDTAASDQRLKDTSLNVRFTKRGNRYVLLT